MKTGIVLMNLGGPDTLSAVEPFLFNLFSDPDIIKLPLSQIFQKPLAWWISSRRAPEVQELYRDIGGRSPILPLTEAQGEALQKRLQELGYDVSIYIAMRYWHPFTEAVVEKIKADEIEHLVCLPLYPQFSYTTTASSMNELRRWLKTHYGREDNWPKLSTVFNFYTHPDYLEALGQTIQEALDSHCWSCPKEEVQVVFSAHSLPKRHVNRTNDPYPDQIIETAKTVMERHLPGQPWELAYQSKVGRMPWLGPTTEGLIQYFAAQDHENILLVPISFVSDHLETLYEIDQMYVDLAKDVGVPHCHRAKALNNHPQFIECLAKLARQKMESAKIPHLVLS